MSKDPAFLFYPADASNDTQFMNRLEKGAYFDLVKSQRMYGGFTTAQLKKILAEDYDKVWPTLEVVMEKDETGKYHIPWLKESIVKRQEFSNKQKERASKRWKNRGNAVALPIIEDVNVIETKIIDIDKDENGNEKVKYRDNVLLSKEEFEKLRHNHGVEITDAAIEYLGHYKKEKNYPTKSDYASLQRWVIDAVKKKTDNGRTLNADYIITHDGKRIYERDIDFTKLGKD